MITSVLEYLSKSSKDFPSKKAIVDGNIYINFKELELCVKRIGCFFVDIIEDRKKPIIVLIRKSYKSIIAFLGIASSGNIYVPLDVNMPYERLNKIIDVVNPKAIVCEDSNYDELKEKFQFIKVIKYEDIYQYDLDEQKITIRMQEIVDIDPLYIMFTSGSTGMPKGVTISHRSVIDFVEESKESMSLSDSDILLNQAPFYFDASVPDVYCMLCNSSTLHIVPNLMFSFPIKLMKYIVDNNINTIFWVPSALVSVANLKALDKYDLSCIKKVMFCGEVMPNKQLNMWRKAIPKATFVNYYGPAETTYACTYYKVNREFLDSESLPIGKPCKNVQILILDNNNNVVTDSNIGELCIKGTCLALGYYNDIEKTKEAFIQNPYNSEYQEIYYRTGDLVKYNEFGELEYVGRKDSQIKHMGYRIELGEIEYVANSLGGINKSCCLYDEINKELVLFYEADREILKIKEIMKEHLQSYMVPTRYIFYENMPMNANGKIDRLFLKNELR